MERSLDPANPSGPSSISKRLISLDRIRRHPAESIEEIADAVDEDASVLVEVCSSLLSPCWYYDDYDFHL